MGEIEVVWLRLDSYCGDSRDTGRCSSWANACVHTNNHVQGTLQSQTCFSTEFVLPDHEQTAAHALVIGSQSSVPRDNLSRAVFPYRVMCPGVYIFSKKCRHHLRILGARKGDMTQVPYWVPTNIRRRSTKFSRHGVLAPGICTPLIMTAVDCRA